MKHPDRYVIGLTGGIACGKSLVLARLTELGAQTIDADQVVHRLQQPGEPVYQRIVAEFGPDVQTAPDGPLDRQKLAAIVFNDPAALRRLEVIVHPAVREAILAWLDALPVQAGETVRPAAVIDAIRLLEGGWQAICDAVWVVTCPEAQQIERLVTRRGMSEAEARHRIAAQPPQASRLPAADVVIDNSGAVEDVLAQVERAWEQALIALQR